MFIEVEQNVTSFISDEKLEYIEDDIFSSPDEYNKWLNEIKHQLTEICKTEINFIIHTQALINKCYAQYTTLLPHLIDDRDLRSTLACLVLTYLKENNIIDVKKVTVENITSSQDSSIYLKKILLNNPNIYWKLNEAEKNYIEGKKININRRDDFNSSSIEQDKSRIEELNRIPVIDYLILFENERAVDSRIEFIPDLYFSDSPFVDDMRRNVLYYFILRGEINLIEKLFNRLFTKANENNYDGNKILNEFVHHHDNYGRTALHIAAKRGNLEIVKFLLQKKFNTLEVDQYGRTALHLAASNNSLQVIEALLQENPNLAEIQDKHGRTALHLAASNNSSEVIELLLEKDPNLINVKDEYGRTALHLAASSNSLQVIEVLLQENPNLAEIQDTDKYGRTALHLAASNNQLEALELLLEKDPNLINVQDSYGRTALHLAASNNQLEAARKCIENCAELLKKDKKENTPLHLAAKSGSIDVLKLLGYEYLYTKDLDEKNENGSTALHKAAYWKRPEAIDVLIESGADVNIKDQKGCTPLVVAMKVPKNFYGNPVELSKEIIAKLINYDYSIFVSPKPVWSSYTFQEMKIPPREETYIDQDLKEFVKKIYNLLSKNKNILKPLPSEQQDHIPLITKAVTASNKELVQKIMSNFQELLNLSEIQYDELKQSITNSQLYLNQDPIVLELYEYCLERKPEISKEQYKIFEADQYGNSEISNLILEENYEGLLSLLKKQKLLTEFRLHDENPTQILKNIVLFTCTDIFKNFPGYKIDDAKSIYNSASHKLYIDGNLDAEVFLAGNEILEMNLWSE